MTFVAELKSLDWDDLKQRIYAKDRHDVERALVNAGKASFEDFLALVSPAADEFLVGLARQSAFITMRRFGRTIQLYVPMYLSNACTNICTYCGFSFGNKLPRVILNESQILGEAHAIKKLGFEHLLLLSGEAPREVGVDYFAKALDLVKPLFSFLAMEVQPLEEDEYARLSEKGLHSVLVYQETYNRERYKICHPKGKKSNFEYRLETPDRLGRAGIRKVGLGVLMGLDDWRVDAAMLAAHLSYLRRTYWKTKFSVSFPRIRPAEGVSEPQFLAGERALVQAISAFRLFDENVELVLSTRERAEFRDQMIGIGITAMSAGSKTDPGGYAENLGALEQFSIDDSRSPADVAQAICARGYEPVWKDWDAVYS